MARPLRIELAGGLYHVMSRGNERRAMVRDDADRQRRLDWLERTVQTHGWRLHAFALLTNHEHVFVETPEPVSQVRCRASGTHANTSRISAPCTSVNRRSMPLW